MKETIGSMFIMTGYVFMLFGIIGLYRFKEFYTRILLSSVIDTGGFILIMVGIMIYEGFNSFTLKVLLILITVLILNPVSSHSITRSAYYSGYHMKK